MVEISIIVNVYNEEKNIRSFIERLANQRFQDFELIIVDDGSTDNTLQIIEEYKNKLPIRIIESEHVGLKKARAKGIEEVCADRFLVLDVDIVFDSYCVGKFVSAFDTDDIGAVTGKCLSKGDNWVTRGSGLMAEGAHRALRKGDGTKDATSGGFSAYRTKAIEEVGGFALEDVAADLEIAWRLQQHNWKVITDDIVGFHCDPDTLKGIFKWGFSRGKMGFHTRWQYKRKLLQWQHLVRFGPLALVLTALVNRRVAFGGLLSSLIVFLFFMRGAKSPLLDKLSAWVVLLTKMLGWDIGFLVESINLVKARNTANKRQWQ